MFLSKIARLPLALLCGLLVAAGANGAPAERKRDDAAKVSKPGAKPALATPGSTYTNADLEKLPTPENDRLPTLDPPPGATPLPPVPPGDAAPPASPTPATPTDAAQPVTAPVLPTAAAPGGAPQPTAKPGEPPTADPPRDSMPADSPSAARVDPETIEWVRGRVESLHLDQAIAAARRRLDDATERLSRLRGTLRPAGSAFPADTADTEAMYVRGVADHDNRHDAVLQRAYDEQAAARADLERLLAGPVAPER